MSKTLQVNIRIPKESFGGESYTIHIDATNITKTTVRGVSVVPQFLPGTLIHELPSTSDLDDLKRRKRQVIEEMRMQIRVARIRSSVKNMNPLDKFTYIIAMSILRSVGIPETVLFTRVPWTLEALSIEDWDDIERVEKEIISVLDERNFLRRMFSLNKDKLHSIQEKIVQTEKPQNENASLSDTYSIQPTETVTFTYKAKAPTLFREKTYSLQFNISYNSQENETKSTFSSYQTISFYPSAFAIPLGASIGALTGYLVKVSLINSTQTTWFTPLFWFNLVGSIALAIVFALLTVRTPTSKKVITAEDFIGGFILGALVGIFSEAILDRLKAVVTKL